MFKINDRVRSIGMNSRDYGTGRVISVKLNVATVLFENQATESFNFAMLRGAKDA